VPIPISRIGRNGARPGIPPPPFSWLEEPEAWLSKLPSLRRL
jgi:hypothetical protein